MMRAAVAALLRKVTGLQCRPARRRTSWDQCVQSVLSFARRHDGLRYSTAPLPLLMLLLRSC